MIAQPMEREAALRRRYAGIKSLFEAPTCGVHITSHLDLEFFQGVAAEREAAGERHLWVLLCAPAASALCHVDDAFLQSLAAVYVLPPPLYVEADALGLLGLCERQLVNDALSWWAAYLSPRVGARVFLRDFWEEASGSAGAAGAGEGEGERAVFEIEASLREGLALLH